MLATAESFYCILQFAPVEATVYNLGVLLYDEPSHRLLTFFRDDYGFAGEEEIEVLSALGADLAQKATESDDPIEMIEHFEDTLSNNIRISARTIIEIDRDPKELLNEIYLKHFGGELTRRCPN